MTTTLIASYVGQGLAAARPGTPALDTGAIGYYYATDTAVWSAYLNGSWVDANFPGTIGLTDFSPSNGNVSASGFFLGRTLVVPANMIIRSVKIPIQSAAGTAAIYPAIYDMVLGASIGTRNLLASGPLVTGAVVGVQTFPLTTPLAVTKDQVICLGFVNQVATFNICQRNNSEEVQFATVASGGPPATLGSFTDAGRQWGSFWGSAT